MPASTLLDIGSAALTSIGQLGRGQSASPEDAALILRRTNLLLRKWSAQRLFLFNVNTRIYTLQANTADYPIGPTAAPPYTDTRPNFIESAAVEVFPNSDNWRPLTVLDKPEWDAILSKDATAYLPEKVWPEPAFPNYIAHVNPKPTGTPRIRLGCWEPLTEFATVFTTFALPPEYEEGLESNLAITLCADYDQPVTPALQQRAADGLATIMKKNAQGMGGALGEAQKLQSPNVGQPLPGGAPAPGGPPQA